VREREREREKGRGYSRKEIMLSLNHKLFESEGDE